MSVRDACGGPSPTWIVEFPVDFMATATRQTGQRDAARVDLKGAGVNRQFSFRMLQGRAFVDHRFQPREEVVGPSAAGWRGCLFGGPAIVIEHIVLVCDTYIKGILWSLGSGV